MVVQSLYDDPEYGKSWMYFPDSNGTNVKVWLNETILSNKAIFRKTDVQFLLYTKLNKNKPKRIYIEMDKYHNYNPKWKTKIVVHGWTNYGESPAVQLIKNNFLNVADYNVIIVDWGKLAQNKIYQVPATQTLSVGKYVAKLIDSLVKKKNTKLSQIHLIGHSLGAHVVGIAGGNVISGKISRITGLDPALPLFANTPNYRKLNKHVAEFVDVIHTNAHIAGMYLPIGHVDFYVNGGTILPNCPSLNCVSSCTLFMF